MAPDYKLVEDNDDHFVIGHPDGSQFKVASANLDDDVLSRIKSLPPLPDNLKPAPEPTPDERYQQILQEEKTRLSPDIYDPATGHSAKGALHPVMEAQAEDAALNRFKSMKDMSTAEASRSQRLAAEDAQKQQQKASRMEALGLSAPQVAPMPTALDQMPDGSVPQVKNMAEAEQTYNQPAQAGAAGNPGDPFAGLPPQFAAPFQAKSQAIDQMAAARSQESQDVAKAYAANVEQQQKLQAEMEQKRQALDAEHQQLIQQYQSGKIDPHRVWGDMSTGNKILASVSMVLGGLGSGLSGGPNVAMEVINKAIDRDIDAQKENMGKTHNLLSMNMQQYHNLDAAITASRLQANAATQAMVGQAAAKAGTPQAIAQANMMKADLQQQAIPLKMQLAELSARSKSLGAGGGEGGLPVGQEPLHMLGDKDYQAKRVVVGEKAFQAATPEDAKELKNIQAEYGPVKQMLEELDGLGAEAMVPGTQANLRASALRATLVPRLNKLHGLNRLSEEDIKIMGDQVSDPRKFSQMLTGNGGIKNHQFYKNLADDVESNYKTRLINYKGISKYKSWTPNG